MCDAADTVSALRYHGPCPLLLSAALPDHQVCQSKGRQVISALTPVWARDATYWPYPGIVDGKAMWDTNVTIVSVLPGQGCTRGCSALHGLPSGADNRLPILVEYSLVMLWPALHRSFPPKDHW